jgi:hypothetical protein
VAGDEDGGNTAGAAAAAASSIEIISDVKMPQQTSAKASKQDK